MNSSLLALLHFPSSWYLNPRGFYFEIVGRGQFRRGEEAPLSSDLNTLELMTYLVFFQPRETWTSWLSLEAWRGTLCQGISSGLCDCKLWELW